MDGSNDGELGDDWLLDPQPVPISIRSPLRNTNQVDFYAGETSISASPHCALICEFVGMGFSESMVTKAIEENGEGNAEAILETLLTYSERDDCLSDKEKTLLRLVEMGFSQEDASSAIDACGPDTSIMELMDFVCAAQMAKTSESHLQESPYPNCSDKEEDDENLSNKEKLVLDLVDMGFAAESASSAIDACGSDTSIMELMDFICAAEMEKAFECHLQEPPYPFSNGEELSSDHTHEDLLARKKRKKLFEEDDRWQRKSEYWKRKDKESKKNQDRSCVQEGGDGVHIPMSDMTGFGVPKAPKPWFRRTLPEVAIGPPYFYYENVACTPKGVWSTISRFLYDIEPEFVDSVHFSAAARKRGYVHNLPVHNRYPLQPIPPRTIHEAFPELKKWWPSWDPRTTFNCLNTCTASAKNTERIRKALEIWDEDPPLKTQKYVLYECRKWNLIWTGKNRTAPLEPGEMEMLLGYPKNHTRGASKTERLRALGNSFQDMFPNGLTVLSLFSGIGGAEVALDRLGIPLKTVVSVEISEVSRSIFRSWWEQTNQKGNLIEVEDVQKLNPDKLEPLIHSLGGFDLIVGGSPCNNLTGNNRYSRDGLKGEQSVLFYDYFRILESVKSIMGSS